MAVEIVPPKPEDAESGGRRHEAAWREAYSSLLPASFWTGDRVQRRIDGWRRHLEHPARGSIVRLARREDGAAVGFAISGPPEADEPAPPVRDLELQAMYVLASEYGTGLGARLLEAVLPDARPAQLWVFEANPRARRFYEKHGFRPDGARHVFGPEWDHQPEIRMVR